MLINIYEADAVYFINFLLLSYFMSPSLTPVCNALQVLFLVSGSNRLHAESPLPTMAVMSFLERGLMDLC